MEVGVESSTVSVRADDSPLNLMSLGVEGLRGGSCVEVEVSCVGVMCELQEERAGESKQDKEKAVP